MTGDMKRFLQFLFSNNPKDAEPDEKTPSGASEKPKSSRSLPTTVEFDHKRADNPEVREYLRLCAKEIPCKEIKNVDAVEQLLVRFAEKGAGDLHFFVNELSAICGIPRKEAVPIAHHMRSRIKSKMSQISQLSLGMEYGTWRFADCGAKSCPHHKAEKKIFRIAKGLYINGEWILPGEN